MDKLVNDWVYTISDIFRVCVFLQVCAKILPRSYILNVSHKYIFGNETRLLAEA